jgi:hypothetical protein
LAAGVSAARGELELAGRGPGAPGDDHEAGLIAAISAHTESDF